jgi:hypothetical protein
VGEGTTYGILPQLLGFYGANVPIHEFTHRFLGVTRNVKLTAWLKHLSELFLAWA